MFKCDKCHDLVNQHNIVHCAGGEYDQICLKCHTSTVQVGNKVHDDLGGINEIIKIEGNLVIVKDEDGITWSTHDHNIGVSDKGILVVGQEYLI